MTAVTDCLTVLRARRLDDNVIELPAQLSGSADSLADDYAALAREVLLRIAQAEQATSLTTVGR